MKFCQYAAKVFTKMCIFEVSIGLLPLIFIVLSKEFLYRSLVKIQQHGAKIFIQNMHF